MGCSKCGTGGSSLPRRSGRSSLREPVGDCVYTLELMEIWKTKLNCIRDNNLFSELGITKYKINSAEGYVQSALNTGDPCIFIRQLDEVNDIILNLINSGKCQ